MRGIGRLSARRTATAGTGTHSDGGGLYLRVQQDGAGSNGSEADECAK